MEVEKINTQIDLSYSSWASGAGSASEAEMASSVKTLIVQILHSETSLRDSGLQQVPVLGVHVLEGEKGPAPQSLFSALAQPLPGWTQLAVQQSWESWAAHLA